MTAESLQRAFIVMPFGRKKAPDGTEIDFDRVYDDLIRPAVEAAGLVSHRADAERRAGSIHADMFQELLLAELVVADLTIDNPNVWYELGVRDALRASGSVMLYAIATGCRSTSRASACSATPSPAGRPTPTRLESERAGFAAMLRATMPDWRERRAVPSMPSCPT